MSFSHPSHKRLLPGQQVSTSGEVLAYAASAHPDKTGIICGERSWSFKELNAAANQFANGVLERFAGSPGPVGIMARNSAEYVIAHFGTARTGRATANFSTRCTRADLIRTINLTRPVLLILDAESRAMVEEARDQLEAPPVQ
ncbi:MAG: AMP-binding protein, partial [Rhodospirillales bacterium]|nr:AMP-binding protein [Rhodospirillales bacterium]